jgi:hypothetical protein
METRITTGTFVALACSAVLGYAAPQPGTDRNNRGQTTLTGCLQQGSSPRSYVLVQSPGSSVPDGGVGTVGGRGENGNRYDLVLDSRTDASAMVGKQVQVTGMETAAPVHPQTRGFAVGGLTRFTVKAIKQTGSECPARP